MSLTPLLRARSCLLRYQGTAFTAAWEQFWPDAFHAAASDSYWDQRDLNPGSQNATNENISDVKCQAQRVTSKKTNMITVIEHLDNTGLIISQHNCHKAGSWSDCIDNVTDLYPTFATDSIDKCYIYNSNVNYNYKNMHLI